MSLEQTGNSSDIDARDTLREAYDLLRTEEQRTHWAGRFLDTGINIDIASYNDTSLRPISRAIHNLHQDIWNICSLAYRLEWFRSIAIQDESVRFLWGMSSSLDIEHFHVELRSILDYIANIFGNIAKERGQVRSKSFESLYKWLERDDRNKTKLGVEASKLVLSVPWYREIRNIRNFTVHQGDFTLVFGDPSVGILFQVFRVGFRPMIKTDFLMWNENVVDFRLYSGLYFARILVLLERLGELLSELLSDRIPQTDRNSRSTWMGFHTLKEWIIMLIARLDNSADKV